MPAVLNTNSASLYASKNLQSAQSKMAQSVERLSSGLRINRAKDDAAGLGIANALTTQINGANQGIRNLNDGISMVQTAEGAIAAAQEMGQRILTLATQGANGTLGVNERTALRSELQQLIIAIDSITSRTSFSGNSLLINDPRVAGATKFSLQASNTTSDKLDLSSTAFMNIGGHATTATAKTGGAASTAITLASTPPNSIVGTSVYKLVGTTYTLLGTVSSFSGTAVTLSATTTENWAVTDAILFSGHATAKLGSADLSLAQAVNQTELYSSTAATAATAWQKVQDSASAYITKLSEQRSLLGAYQNQIEYTVSNVTELSANLEAARSNVQDTDYASETATLTKGQILQQAATAMLAQANQMPNVILSLLK